MTIGGTILKGKKVTLREKRLSDAHKDYGWRADSELALLDAAQPIRMTYQEYLRIFEDELRFPSPWSRRLTIEASDTTQIGNCMYYDINYSFGKTELGILIGDRDYWNSGYGTDAVNTLLKHIFNDTPLDLVYLHTLTWNYRAQISFQKSGFAPTKQVRRSGLDFIYMEINREQWSDSNESR